MQPHPDEDLLALHALGEPVLDEAQREHLTRCQACAVTVAGLVGVVDSVRGPGHDPHQVAAEAVPAYVWQGISDELGLDPSVRPASVGPSSLRPRNRHTRHTQDTRPSPDRQRVGDTQRAPDGGRSEGESVGPLGAVGVPAHGGSGALGHAEDTNSSGRSPSVAPVAVDAPAAGPSHGLSRSARRSRRTGPPVVRLLAVAAAGLAIGAAGAAYLLPRSGAEPAGGRPSVLAAADLDAFGAGAGTPVTGSARLTALGDTAGVRDGCSRCGSTSSRTPARASSRRG